MSFSATFAKRASMIEINFAVLSPVPIILANSSTKPSCLLTIAIVFNVAHLTSASDFFCENCNALNS